MGEKRRWGNWDRGNHDDGGQWPSKSPRRWGQPNHTGFNARREGEGSTKPTLNGWGDCYSTAASWERTFCTAVCRVPWRKICDAKRVTSIYKNVTEWDDSAGREAFENAKARYWAKINRLPCITLPDPYIYIDKVNFDAFIDPELAADLESVTINPDNDNKAEINHLGTSAHGTLPATGCDEAEHSSTNWDKYIEKPLTASGWDDTVPGTGDSCNAWGCSTGWGDGIAQCDPWGSRRNHSMAVNGRESLRKDRVSWKDQDDSWRPKEGWKNGQDRRNNSWKYLNSRYPVDEDQMRSSWRYSGGNNMNNHSFEKKVQFLGSRNHQRTGYSGSPWQRENAVS